VTILGPETGSGLPEKEHTRGSLARDISHFVDITPDRGNRTGDLANRLRGVLKPRMRARNLPPSDPMKEQTEQAKSGLGNREYQSSISPLQHEWTGNQKSRQNHQQPAP
jgi:hypothetical protein